MSNEKIIDNNDEMRLDGMSEVNIDKMVDASEHHLIDDEEVRMLMDELEKACAEKYSGFWEIGYGANGIFKLHGLPPRIVASTYRSSPLGS